MNKKIVDLKKRQKQERSKSKAKAKVEYLKQHKLQQDFLDQIKKSLKDVGDFIGRSFPEFDIEPLTKELRKLSALDEKLNQVHEDIQELIKKDFPEPKSEVKLANIEEIIKAIPKHPEWLNEKVFKTLEDALFGIKQELEDKLVKGQTPEEFLPFRRVRKIGNNFEFDDGSWGGSSGGGVDTSDLAKESTQTDGTQKTQIVDPGGEAVTITNNKLDVNASVDTTGLATSANQVTEIASLSVLDDWDESDRAKVNPIVGQAGVAGGSGTVGATTQRVTLATDVALPTGTNQIGSIVPDRPSQGTGRVYKTAALTVQTADQTLYTVTNGKTLYVTSMVMFAFNTSTASSGSLLVLDGVGGTTRYPTLMTAAGVAGQLAASAAVGITITFAEPLQFTTSIHLDITAGTVTYSAMMVGYEA